jgi:phage gp46-like protein
MTDIALVLNTTDSSLPSFDWGFSVGDLSLDNSLQTAVMISLFTDARAPAGFIPPDGTTDLRGCWIDTYEGQFGSLLWTLYRAKKSDSFKVLSQAKSYAEQALQWLIDTGVAASVIATATWETAADRMALQIVIQQANLNSPTTLSFSNAWSALSTQG